MRKIVVFGIGLIGGSLAFSIRNSMPNTIIVGIDTSPEFIDYALKHGIIDKTMTIEDAMKNADIVFLSTPVSQTYKILNSIVPHLEEKTLITDAGSTKQDVITQARSALKDKINQFIPGHPIAGSEQSGPSAATHHLYNEKKVILTPLKENNFYDIQRIEKVWKLCGAVVEYLSPEEHDKVFATVSHLPHLLSYAFMNSVANKENAETLLHYAGSGFKDFTRLAGSSSQMWADISSANKKAIVEELDAYMHELSILRSYLHNDDKQKLLEMYEHCQMIRSTGKKPKHF